MNWQRFFVNSIVDLIMRHQRSFLLAMIALLFVLFFAGGPGLYSLRSIKYAWNFGHIIFFCLLVGFLLSEFKLLITRPLLQQLALILLMSVVVGGSVELIQSGLSRNPDLGDMWRNAIGALLGFVLFSRARVKWSLISYSLSVAVVLILIAFQVKPLLIFLVDEAAARKEFPLLSSFEHDRELSRFDGSADYSFSEVRSVDGVRSLKVITDLKRFSGISLKNFPRDWSGYGQLKFDIYSVAEENIELIVRINDVTHGYRRRQRYDDRFNHMFVLQSGWNEVDINLSEVESAPVKRSMNMADIERVEFFVTSEPAVRTFYLDHLRLLP